MFRDYFQYVVGELQKTGMQIVQAFPAVLTAAVIIGVTLLIGKLARNLTTKLLRAIGVNVISRRAGIDRYLQPTELASGLSELIGTLAYWILLFLGITYALKVVGFDAAENLLGTIAHQLPAVVVSIIILVIGVHVAAFLGNLARRAAVGAGISYAGLIGAGVRIVVLLIACISIIEELAVNLDFLRLFFYVLVGCTALVFTIVFGVGGIQIGREILASIVVRKTIRPGDRLVWEDRIMIVDETTIVYTRLHGENNSSCIPNTILMRNMTLVE